VQCAQAQGVPDHPAAGPGGLDARAAAGGQCGVPGAPTIFLIRHGETLGNAARVVQRPDNPLSPRGRAQAQRLARRLAAAGITRIVASDYARAAMTAEHLRQATGIPVKIDPLLRERSFGDLRGRSYDEIGFDIFAPDYAPPNGESWDAFHARVDRAWALVQDLATAAGGHLAVVTHGLVCRSLAARHLLLSAGQEVPLRWENTSVTEVDASAPWRVRLLNCAAHLDDLAPSDADAAAV
jgi:probable phosphoglycerate mutase